MASYFATLETLRFFTERSPSYNKYYIAYTVYKQRNDTTRGLNGDRLEREVKPVTGLV